MEIAFTASTADINKVEINSLGHGTQLVAETTIAEICRVRMNTETALSTSLNVIFALLQEGRIEGDRVQHNIDAMIKSVSSREEEQNVS